ncbi:MAG: DUF115 domain-containing protein [Spirochaetia bacterium]|nr:DUF115 domain-containing protein [Spirochaetia bacterium]
MNNDFLKKASANLNYLEKENCLYYDTNYDIKNKIINIKSFSGNIENENHFTFQKNNVWYHSRKDPYREAKRQLHGIIDKNKNTKHLILIGAGAGYIIHEAFLNNDIESILLIEPDLEVLVYLLNLVIIQEIIKEKKLYIYFPENINIINLEPILPFIKGKKVETISIFTHPASYQAYSSLYTKVQDKMANLIEKRAVNQATLIKFQDIWNKNISLNIKEIILGEKLINITSKIKTENIVIAGAGPSLSESYEELKKYRSNFLLIAADTAYIPLIKNNIIPDIVIAADPQWLNHYYVLSKEVKKSIWILDPVVCHVIPHFLIANGCTMIWWDNPFYIDQIIRNHYGDRGEIAHGGSVTTNAFDLAVKFKARNIILTGQDLSFSNKTAHVKGSVLENMIYYKMNKYKTIENHNLKQMKALPALKVTSIKDNNIFTNAKLKVFIEWFENQAKIYNSGDNIINLYNATKNGVKLKGFIYKDISEIFTNDNERLKVNLDINKENVIHENLELKIKNKLELILFDFNMLEKLYIENIKMLFEAKRNPVKEKIKSLISKITANDEKIKKYNEANQILSIGAQHTILEITEGSNSAFNDDGTIFYKAMLKTCKRTRYLFKKMIHILSFMHVPG